jgi:predicted permease
LSVGAIVATTGFLRDVFRSLRGWRRTPGSAVLVVLALGLSGGAFLTLVSLVDALIWRDLPVFHPEELVGVSATERGAPDWENVDAPASLFTSLDPTGRVFRGVAGFEQNRLPAATKSNGQPLAVEGVSDRYFETLGVGPAVGRVIGPRDVETASAVATISFRCWQTRFGADPDVIGETFRLQDERVSVVGVAPRDFEGVNVGEPADVWVPASLLPRLDREPQEPVFFRGLLGRLRPGATLQQASREVESLWPSARQAAAAAAPPDYRAYILGVQPRIQSGARGFSQAKGIYGRTIVLLAVLSGIAVVLACTNLSGLLLARWSTREPELAVQAALGASNGRLVSQIIGESLALSVVAVLLSAPVALWSAKSLVLLLWDQPDAFPLDLSLNYRVLGVMILLAGVVAVGVSLLPASRVWSAKITVLRGTRSLAGRSAARWGHWLVAAQIALAVPLLAATWMIAVNLNRLEAVNTGFRSDGVTVVSLNRQGGAAPAEGPVAHLVRLAAALRETPGISAVGFSWRDPVAGFFSDESRRPVTSGGGVRSMKPFVQTVSPGYFASLSVPFVAGRDFAWTDVGGQQDVAVITADIANVLFPGTDPIGQRVRVGGSHDRDVEVIGVVTDAKLANPHERNQSFLYVALLQQPLRSLEQNAPEVLIKSPLPTNVVRAQAERALVRLGGDEIFDVHTLQHLMARELVLERVMRLGAFFFAGLTALLVFVGLYAVLNFGVARRIPEIGLRIALGASTGDIRLLVIREVLRISATGLLVGIPCAFLAGRLIESALTLVGSHDPVAFGVALLLILAASGLSVLIPLRRVSRVTPVEALGKQ